jgi:MoaA/NifB/PqqE/SkfB family radical SAM enzyme
MKLNGLHLLLTYSCNLECDHCFVWGSPGQGGTMTIAVVDEILRQAAVTESIEWIYFEGGEPFLHYPVLLHGVRVAAAMGFRVGIVTNGYWATDADVGVEWLRPMEGLVADLSLSRDPYHGEALVPQVEHAQVAARRVGIPTGVISIAAPECTQAVRAVGQLPDGESALVFRGRAAERLAPKAEGQPWEEFDRCPCEDLREPGRVHVDYGGDVHICQGLRLGNLHRIPLAELCRAWAPNHHAVVGPLLRGGPAELARVHGVTPRPRYADACHLCDATRRALRDAHPQCLGPDQMYGVSVGASA